MEADARRLDRWLWFARFCRSRTLAAKLCAAGKIRVDGQPVHKAHCLVRPGEVLTFPQGPHIRVVRILRLGLRRGPASEARALYEDLAPLAPAAASPTMQRQPGRPARAELRPPDRRRDRN
jgi:ribosome-associated heat shock protein Hsp15